MIYLDGTILDERIRIESINGIYDFPAMKQKPQDWGDTDLLDFDDSDAAWQFGSKDIKVNCVLNGGTYSECKAKFDLIDSDLAYDGLKMLHLPTYSNRYFMVSTKDCSNVKTNYQNNVCIFQFTITFHEPQPNNVQFWFEVGEFDELIELEILSAEILNPTDEQTAFVNIYYNDEIDSRDLIDNPFESSTLFPGSGVSGETIKYPCIITGEIDRISYIYSNYLMNNKTIAEYYLRNGTITVV